MRAAETGDNETVTRTWEEVLALIESVGKEAVPHLKELLQDERPRMRVSALMAFAVIGPAAGDAFPVLMKCRDDEDESVRTVMAHTISRVNPGGAQTREILDSMVEDESPGVRIGAARELWAGWGDAGVALSTLLEIVKDRDSNPGVQYVALKVLRDMGPAATKALPLLRRLVRDDPDYLRGRGLYEITDEAIGKILRRQNSVGRPNRLHSRNLWAG